MQEIIAKPRVAGTIITCEHRVEHYAKLQENLDELKLTFPIKTFKNPYKISNTTTYKTRLFNSCLNSNNAYAWMADTVDLEKGWCVFLEDDQVIFPAFKANLQWLMDFGDEHNIACWMLHNRWCKRADRGFELEHLNVNRLQGTSPGTHGLMFRARFLPQLLEYPIFEPDDWKFFRVVNPRKYLVYQVVNPVLMQHDGAESTYHYYGDNRHLRIDQPNGEQKYLTPAILNGYNKSRTVAKVNDVRIDI